eukprot:354988-Chlamydomonas_euryale.AAC.7
MATMVSLGQPACNAAAVGADVAAAGTTAGRSLQQQPGQVICGCRDQDARRLTIAKLTAAAAGPAGVPRGLLHGRTSDWAVGLAV